MRHAQERALASEFGCFPFLTSVYARCVETLPFVEQLRGLYRAPHREQQQAFALASRPARQPFPQTHGKLFEDLGKAVDEGRRCGAYSMWVNTSAEAAPRLAMAADDSTASTNVAGNCAPAEFRAMLLLLLLLLLLLPPSTSSSSKTELGAALPI